jgi:hypothetical protein
MQRLQAKVFIELLDLFARYLKQMKVDLSDENFNEDV